MAVEGGGGPADEVEARVVAVLGEHLAEVLRLGLREQGDLHPDLGEHRSDGLADPLVVDVAVVGAVHGELEAVRIAGLGQQLLRLRDVVRRPVVQRLGEAIDLRGDHQARGNARAAHDFLLDRLDVDGVNERLADPKVLERVLALDVGVEELVPDLIEAEEDGPRLGAGEGLDPLRIREPLPVLHRHGVGHVHVPRDEGRDPGRVLRDGGEDALGDVALHLAPVVGVGDEHRLHPGLPRLEGERAGAVGVQVRVVALVAALEVGHLDGVVPLRPLAVHDVEDLELEREDRVRRGGDEVDGVVVDDPGVLDELGDDLEVRALGPDPLDGERHVVGREVRTVVELDALAEVEAPGVRLDVLPPFGERSDQLHVLVARDEALVDAPLEAEGHGLEQAVRIHRLHVALERPAERLGLGGRGGNDTAECCGRGDGLHSGSHHLSPSFWSGAFDSGSNRSRFAPPPGRIHPVVRGREG